MRKTEVYQVRLDSQEKKQAFAVFKQLGITPAQAVRLFFKQVVLTKSIPFSIENQNINLEQLIKLRKLKQEQKATLVDATPSNEASVTGNNSVEDFEPDDEHLDLFDELNAILGEIGDLNTIINGIESQIPTVTWRSAVIEVGIGGSVTSATYTKDQILTAAGQSTLLNINYKTLIARHYTVDGTKHTLSSQSIDVNKSTDVNLSTGSYLGSVVFAVTPSTNYMFVITFQTIA